MNPKLVGCLGASTAIGGACALATILAGGGFLLGLAAYSFGGSIALVLIAALAFQERAPRAAPTPTRVCA